MTNILSPGSFSYPSGIETAAVLASGANLPLTTAYNNNPVELMALGVYASMTLPAANTAGLATGQAHFVGMVHPGSQYLRVYNSGIVGSEPVLEKVIQAKCRYRLGLLANTSGVANGVSYSASGGLWNFQYEGADQLKMLCAVQPGPNSSCSIATGLGVTIQYTNQASTFMLGNNQLGATVSVDSSHNIWAIGWQSNVDGTGFACGSGWTLVQAASGSAYAQPSVTAVSANDIALFYLNASLLYNKAVMLTVTSGASHPTISVGTAIATSGLAASGNFLGNNINSINDFGTTGVWLTGENASSASGLAHYYSCNTTSKTIALSAFNTYGSIGSQQTRGMAVASGKIVVPGGTGGLSMLSYSAGAISSVWSSGFGPGGSYGYLFPVDVTNLAAARFLAISSNQTGIQTLNKCTQNLNTGAPIDYVVGLAIANDVSLAVRNLALTDLSQFVYLGDGEFVGNSAQTGLTAGPSGYTDYIDLDTYFKGGMIAANTPSANDIPSSNNVMMQSCQMDSNPGGYPLIYPAFDPVSRRIVTMNSNSATLTSFTLYQFPKK